MPDDPEVSTRILKSVPDGHLKGPLQDYKLSILEVTSLSLHLPVPCVLTSYGQSSGAVLFRQEGVHWLEMLTLTLLNVFLEAWSRE